jgi:hypothetical protein
MYMPLTDGGRTDANDIVTLAYNTYIITCGFRSLYIGEEYTTTATAAKYIGIGPVAI